MTTSYHKFLKHWQEVVDLPIQNVGPLTPYYKMLSRRLKVMPWPVFVIISALIVIGLYYLLGPSIVRLVSILQRGF